ncbi:hypothetical protein E2C01_046600 [Portunus trituberculatus]|uniref:Uncharacterized protein n=1 Tax=Portunus trituberculatus TaxID=210409 RepID=A0A5B7G870_PORTR|nr:hypothetical protein [Portunus trituberculatus]
MNIKTRHGAEEVNLTFLSLSWSFYPSQMILYILFSSWWCTLPTAASHNIAKYCPVTVF